MYKSFLVSFLLTTCPLVSVAESCDVLNGQWETVETRADNCAAPYETTNNVFITVNGSKYSQSATIVKSSDSDIYTYGDETGICVLNNNKAEINTSVKAMFITIFSTKWNITVAPDLMSYKGTFTTEDNCGQHGTILAKRLSPPLNNKHESPSAQDQSTGDNSSSNNNSNSSNTNASTRPHRERVNLPGQSGCISMGESNKQDPTSTSRWFLLKNSCAYPVHVSWCTGASCINSIAAHTLSGGGTYETWGTKDSDDRVHLNIMACQLKSGNDEVYMDWPNKQCWANVEMQ